MKPSALEFRIVDKTWEQPLIRFFRILQDSGISKHFHPHPFTEEEAKKRAQYLGEDLYYVLVEGDEVIGYGMLRGWDEGYEVPSLGIVIHPSVQRAGLGKLFMHFLHSAARRRGATRIRLKVYPYNKSAIELYKGLGYTFQAEERGQLVGFIDM